MNYATGERTLQNERRRVLTYIIHEATGDAAKRLRVHTELYVLVLQVTLHVHM